MKTFASCPLRLAPAATATAVDRSTPIAVKSLTTERAVLVPMSYPGPRVSPLTILHDGQGIVRTMTLPPELVTAMEFARRWAEKGREGRPFDPVYVHALDQLKTLDRHVVSTGDLSNLKPGEIDVGRMAVKELGNDEQDYAHPLHIIQWYADDATGENAENR